MSSAFARGPVSARVGDITVSVWREWTTLDQWKVSFYKRGACRHELVYANDSAGALKAALALLDTLHPERLFS